MRLGLYQLYSTWLSEPRRLCSFKSAVRSLRKNDLMTRPCWTEIENAAEYGRFPSLKTDRGIQRWLKLPDDPSSDSVS
jgi:hypothetical protein